jgi:glutamine amidotransferase
MTVSSHWLRLSEALAVESPAMKLFACMCNQPQRLPAALAPVRAALVAQPPVTRWGLGYVQGGDVLLVRTPKFSERAIDLASPLMQEIRTDCAIAQAVREDRASSSLGGTDNTPPFRFRRWMFAQTGTPKLDAIAPRLLEHVPEYLRRNMKGRTPAELIFHVFLSMLHDEGNIEDPNLPPASQRRALAATLRLVNSELEKAGLAGDPSAKLGNVALTNGRSMVLAHLAEPLRLRRLTVTGERGERDDSFRGYVLISGGDGDHKDGFEDVPPQSAVLISRDLQLSFADLAP